MNGSPDEFSFAAAWARRRGLALSLAALAVAACIFLFPPAKAACGCVFLFGLIGAALIDADHMIIPDIFTVGLAAAGVALSLLVPALHGPGAFFPLACLRSGAAALLGLLIGSAIALWIGIVAELVLDREALGFGDVKLLGAIGAFCGWRGAVFALFGGALLGAVVCAIRALRLSAPFPFGPMLAAAAAGYFLYLHHWVDRYLTQYLVFF